ncbi:MAG: RNA-binding transcriptional accessory protein [Flavobacteriales bacterium]|nr:RNA-binding transcriptional accessory protein [Flavobacteriales bacterium]
MQNKIAAEVGCKPVQVASTLSLIAGGATVPFISRYRKEPTGGLDEVQIGKIKDLFERYTELEKRRETILASLKEQDVLTPELKKKVEEASTSQELEDLYLPFRPKRKTRATKAIELGLEPLAKILMAQNERFPETAAQRFVKGDVALVEDALQGARDIIAEWMSENASVRSRLRQLFQREATIVSKMVKGKEEEGEKFRDYFKHEEPLKRVPSHRFLAMLRGEKEGFLRVGISPTEENALQVLERFFVKGTTASSDEVRTAAKDAYKRLLQPSLETEMRSTFKEQSDEQAINVFAENLRQLLMLPPLGEKRVLALDPGYRSGCKVVCLNAQGDLVHNENIYPHPPKNERSQAMKKLSTLVEQYQIEAIAIGNGTASRETEALVKAIHFDRKVQVFVVSEAGASIYSASKVARDEFPQFDVTVRGSVSIGRRLIDPLAELVKIDPAAIGVGQYQHDVDQKKLMASLERVTESCVNQVGVNLNTASKFLLTHVSGLGPQLADNILEFRQSEGPFSSREELKKVPRLGAKAFEQAAGFLRIPNGKHALDNSAVHPESYPIVKKMAKDSKVSVSELLGNEELVNSVNLSNYVTETVGLPTLEDIKSELLKPGRDPRRIIKVFEFERGIEKITDLIVGMELPGIVTNITAFGAFVDVGVKQDGLVHISQLADRFVKDPTEVVSVHQHVKVKVLEVDASRKRIAFSMKGGPVQRTVDGVHRL